MVTPVNEIPEPWASSMIAAGFVDGRYKASNARPSARALAEAVGVHTSTITRMFAGSASTDHQTVSDVADALGKSRVEVTQWVLQSRSVEQDWTPPAAVHQLTQREQEALTELINAIAAAREDHDDARTAPMYRAGGRPAKRTAVDDEVPYLSPEQQESWDLTADEGHSEGKRLRERHDEVTEAPDPESGDEPA